MPREKRCLKRNLHGKGGTSWKDYGYKEWLEEKRTRSALSRMAPKSISRIYRERIEQAMESQGAVLLIYRDAYGIKTKRRVRPEEWADEYRFVAFCELREDYRTFRLDRILDCQDFGVY